MYKNQIFNDNVNKFFRDERLRLFYNDCNFDNNQTLKNKMQNINNIDISKD